MTAKNRIAKYLWTFIKYFSLILAGFIAVLPVASCVITAFKTPEEYASTNVMTLPGKFYFKNFTEAFQKANMGVAFLKQLDHSCCCTVLLNHVWCYACLHLKSFHLPRQRNN